MIASCFRLRPATVLACATLLLTVACAGNEGTESEGNADNTEADAGAAIDGGAGEADAAGGSPDTASATDTGPTQPVQTNIMVGPSVLEDTNSDPKIVEVKIVAGATKMKLFDDVAELEMYTYNGQVPGPTLEANVGDKVIVHFENHLDEKTTIHWHGLRISDQMDGNPRIQKPVEPGGKFTYEFVVTDAGTHWYHPHVRTNEQLEKGLAGAIVVHEKEQPVVATERVLVMDDILVNKDGHAPFLKSHPEVMHGRSGNRLLINGAHAPTKATAKLAQIERWRIVNVANARTMHFDVSGEALVRVVGTAGGLLEKPFMLDKPLTVPVGARFDLEVLYGAVGEVTLRSYVPVLDANNKVVYKPFAQLIVDVKDDPNAPSAYKTPFPGAAALPVRTATRKVTMDFRAVQAPGTPTGVNWLINNVKDWMSKPLFTFEQGDTVEMTIKNLAGPEHPFHLHGQFFEILEPKGHPGLRDTVLVPGMQTVTIRAWMDNPGQWMAHCHILEHAEQGMMSEIVVTPKR